MNELKVGNFVGSSELGDIEMPAITEGAPTQEVQDIELPQEPTQEVETVQDIQQPSIESEPSSLKEDKQPEPEKAQPEFNEELTFKYLSEKLGKDVKSIDDLKQTQGENPLDKDPYLKGLAEWREKTGRGIEDYLKYQKDYSKLDDLQVAREFLQHEYPTFTKEEIEAELKSYSPDDMDLDDEAATKARKLKKYAIEGRKALDGLRAELESTPKFSTDVQQDLDLAKKVKQDYELNVKASKEYTEQITSVSSSIDTLKLQLSDDIAIDFKVPEDSKKGLPQMISTMPHWKQEDGSWNHEAIVKDAVVINHYKEMLALAFEQGLNSGKDDVIKQANNINLSQPSPMKGSVDTKGIEIEGYDKFIGNSGMKLRFGRKN